jgi:hypothetical protein
MEQIVVLHFSDTHFGAILANNQFSWLTGWAAHDMLLCRAVPLALDDVRVLLALEDSHELCVAVSGDLTCTGESKEFPVAHSFFRSQWYLRRPPSRGVGLSVQDGRLAYIPGNHDHWDGQRVPPLAYTPSILRQHFYPTPWRTLWKSPGGSLELELYGIDSNAGLKNQSQNFLARGSFAASELAQMENLLQESDAHPLPTGTVRVRAILTHHSLAYHDRLLRKQALDDVSRDRLLDLAGKHRIAAILTGHTHDFYLNKPFLVPVPGVSNHEVHELRSATTL